MSNRLFYQPIRLTTSRIYYKGRSRTAY